MRKILLGIVGLAFVASACSVDLTGRSASSADASPGARDRRDPPGPPVVRPREEEGTRRR